MNVHQDEIGHQFPRFAHGVLARRGSAHDFKSQLNQTSFQFQGLDAFILND
jgi:hypothetical protein